MNHWKTNILNTMNRYFPVRKLLVYQRVNHVPSLQRAGSRLTSEQERPWPNASRSEQMWSNENWGGFPWWKAQNFVEISAIKMMIWALKNMASSYPHVTDGSNLTEGISWNVLRQSYIPLAFYYASYCCLEKNTYPTYPLPSGERFFVQQNFPIQGFTKSKKNVWWKFYTNQNEAMWWPYIAHITQENRGSEWFQYASMPSQRNSFYGHHVAV